MILCFLALLPTQAHVCREKVPWCKQCVAGACDALRQVNPQRATEVKRKSQQALKAGEETVEATEAVADSAPESPACKGQDQRIIHITSHSPPRNWRDTRPCVFSRNLAARESRTMGSTSVSRSRLRCGSPVTCPDCHSVGLSTVHSFTE